MVLNTQSTAVVPANSVLKRKAWAKEGMLQAASKSFFQKLTGSTSDSVIHQEKTAFGGANKQVIFQYHGAIESRPTLGSDTTFGTGLSKKVFSSVLHTQEYWENVDNGREWEASSIDAVDLTNLGDSRSKLMDAFIRTKDQRIFDVLQGLNGQAPSHRIELAVGDFDFNALIEIEKILTTSEGYDTATQPKRMPLKPYMMEDGNSVWLVILDSAVMTKLRQSASYQQIMQHADVRGGANRNIKGEVGRVGRLMFVEAPVFFGTSSRAGADLRVEDTVTVAAGMRQKVGADELWTGQPGFDAATGDRTSRGLILGSNAVQFGISLDIDVRYQGSTDFNKTSELGLQAFYAMQKTRLTEENGDYDSAAVSGFDFGVVALDITGV